MQQSHIKSEIRNWTRLELRQWLEKQSEQDSKIQPYRADQIFYWLYRRKVQDFSEMTNIGKPTRNVLEKHFRIGNLKRDQVLRSRDGSLKFRLMLEDDKAVETVLTPHTPRTSRVGATWRSRTSSRWRRRSVWTRAAGTTRALWSF